jgi:hypothetical protein
MTSKRSPNRTTVFSNIEKKEDVSEAELLQLLNQQNQLLKEQIAAQQVQINVLLNNKPNENQGDNLDENIKINKDDYIKVMSLCPNTLALTTSTNKKFIFREYKEVKRILYSDVVEILEKQPHFAEAGIFYIMDERVVRRHGLNDTYAKLLTKDKLEEIITGSGDTAFGIFKSANETQKKFIIDMLLEKVRDGLDVDMNLVYAISRESKVDIVAKAEEAKEFDKLLMGETKK